MSERTVQGCGRRAGLALTVWCSVAWGCAPAETPRPAVDASVADTSVIEPVDASSGDVATMTDAPRVDAVTPTLDAPEPARDVVAPSADVVTPRDVVTAADVVTPSDAPVVTIDGSRVPAAAALYTTDRTRFGIRDIAGALDHLLTGARVDNVILYVHGRGCGGEPDKSLREAMPGLARDYTSAPVMLYWPGSDESCPLGFPEARAREAGPALAVVLGDLYRYQNEHRAQLAGVQFTLITHSMGSLVLESAVAVSGVDRLPAGLFATAVVNSGASAASDHAAWVSRVTFSRAVFVTENQRDLVLTAAGLGRSVRLGRDLTGVRLAPGVQYVDFSANGVNHAYYIASGQSGAAMIAFYQRVMNGLPYDFATSTGISSHEMRDGATIHHFNGR